MTIFQLKSKLKFLLLLIISSNELDYFTVDTNRLQIDCNKLNDCSHGIKQVYTDSGHDVIYQIYSKLLNKDLTLDAMDVITHDDVKICNIYFDKYKK